MQLVESITVAVIAFILMNVALVLIVGLHSFYIFSTAIFSLLVGIMWHNL